MSLGSIRPSEKGMIEIRRALQLLSRRLDNVSAGTSRDPSDLSEVLFVITGAATGLLTNERLLTAGTNISIVDSGPGLPITISSTTPPISVGLDAFDAYDAIGGQSLSVTPVTLNLDTVRVNDDGAIYSIASDVLTINNSDTYTFAFRVSASNAGPNNLIAWLETDTGGGYAEVPGTKCFMGNV